MVVVASEVSCHTAVVENMHETLPFSTQRTGGAAVSLPHMQVDIVWEGVMSGIEGKLHGVGG